MGHKYAETMFTDNVKQIQEQQGSRSSYSKFEQGADFNATLSESEISFLLERDSFYMATVGETGWPYVQHRGGPKGFIKIIDENTIGFADYRGNRQYISVGNSKTNNKVSLFFMDYKNRRRLKMIGHMQVVGTEDKTIIKKLQDSDYKALVERGIIITIEGFDWNCPQHITPRYTGEDLAPLMARIEELEQQESK